MPIDFVKVRDLQPLMQLLEFNFRTQHYGENFCQIM
jgi:hypothetical protein